MYNVNYLLKRREGTMKTLSVTLADDLYNRIKHTVPSRRVSKFVSEAVEVKLKEQTDDLYKAYLAASQDGDREAILKDWDTINTESWGEAR